MMPKRRTRRPHPIAMFVERTGLSPRTIRRHIAEDRSEYLARSLERSSPWIAEGISRATWYRRRKAAVVQ